MGFLADVYPIAADEIGKIHLIADERVQRAIFDLPEEIAKELLTKEPPLGNSISKISKLPELQDDGPRGDYYGRFSNTDRDFWRSSRGGLRDDGFVCGRRSSRYNSDDDDFRRGRRSSGRYDSWSRNSRGRDDDWLIGGRRSNRSSPSFSRERTFGGSCYICGRSGHRAVDCPQRDN